MLTLQMNKQTLSSENKQVLHIDDLYDDSTALSFPFTPLTPLSPAAYDYNHLTTAGSLPTDTTTLLQSEGPVVTSESIAMSAGMSSCALGRLERNNTLVSYWSADDLVGMDMGLESAATATQHSATADSDAERSTNLTVSKAKYLLDNSILLPDEAATLPALNNSGKPTIKPTYRSSKNRLSKEEPSSATKRPRLNLESPYIAVTTASTTVAGPSTTSVPAESQQAMTTVGKKRRNSAHSVKYAVTFDKGVDDVEQEKLRHKYLYKRDASSTNDIPSATSSLDGQPVIKAKRVLGRPSRTKASHNSDPSDLASSDRPLVLRLSQSSSEFVSDYEYDDDEADVKSDSNHADKPTGAHSWSYPSSRSFFHQATGGTLGTTGYSSGNDDLGSAYFSSGLMTMGSLQNQTLYNHTVRDEVVLDVPEDSRLMVNMRSSASTCSSLQGNETPGARSRAESVSQAEHIDTIHLPTSTLLTSPSHSRQTYVNLDDMTAYSLLSLKYGSSDVTRNGGILSSASSVVAATDFTASPSNRAAHIIPTGSDSTSRSSGSEVADVVPLPLTLPNRS